MLSMKFTYGCFTPTEVKITNKHNHVEFEVIDGFAGFDAEKEVRAATGNILKDLYAHSYSGYYSDRKPCIERLERDIKALEEDLSMLKFALKVTKKKKWVRVDAA